MPAMAARRVVVLGSGAAGLAAAVAAAANGASVTLVERLSLLGGTTAYSGGVVWFPASPWAAAEGVVDSREDALRYLHSLSLGDADPLLAETYVDQCVRVGRAVEDKTPLRFRMMNWPDYHANLPGGKAVGRTIEVNPVEVGPDLDSHVRPDPRGAAPVTYYEIVHGVPDAEEQRRRLTQGIPARGRGLIAGLYAAACQFGVDIRRNARGTKLELENGAVTGVEVGGQILAGEVVVASGGFDRNADFVRRFLRAPLLAPGCPAGNEGDGLRMGMAAGAALGNMSEAWWSPAMEVPGKQDDGAQYYWMLFGDAGKPGSLLVDGAGRRYANEATNYNEVGRAMHAFDAATYSFPRIPSWLICDERRRRAAIIGPLRPDDPDPDWLFTTPSLDALAQRIQVPASNLRDTVERFNGWAAIGRDEDFRRGDYTRDMFGSEASSVQDFLRPLTDPPFYAVRVLPGSLGTKGGLKTDAHARVQRADGSGPIPGLYAAGNASANPFGYGYPGGGATIGPAMVFGWLAGEAASA
jgi:succinate dehydrogenase/fumarate reductase flavoprotein subunit